MKTRKEKINFLKGLLTGQTKINELESDICIYIVKMLEDGSKEYSPIGTNEKISEYEFQKRIANRTSPVFIFPAKKNS